MFDLWKEVSILTGLEAVYWWFHNRLTGLRCMVCNRLFLFHLPWQSYRCNRAPLPITITDAGMALAVGGEQRGSHQPPAA